MYNVTGFTQEGPFDSCRKSTRNQLFKRNLSIPVATNHDFNLYLDVRSGTFLGYDCQVCPSVFGEISTIPSILVPCKSGTSIPPLPAEPAPAAEAEVHTNQDDHPFTPATPPAAARVAVMSAGWGQISMHQPQQAAFHWVPAVQPVHLAARPPTPTRAQTSASPMRRPPHASAAQSPRPGVWSARPPSPGGAGLPRGPAEHQVRQWAVAGQGQPLMPRGGALPPRYSSPTPRYTSPTPPARAEGSISAGGQPVQKAGLRNQSPSHGTVHTPGIAVKQHRSAGAGSPARRPPASPPLLIPAEPANSLAKPGGRTDKAFDAEPVRPERPASVQTVIASDTKPNEKLQGLEKRTAEKLHDLQQAIRAHASTMGVDVNAMLMGDNASNDEILLREAGLQVMRDRARAKSAESALFYYQGSVAMILEKAQRDQAEMLRS